MNDFYYKSLPIATGTPRLDQKPLPQTHAAQQPERSFRDVLQNSLEAQKSLTFSKHAAQRAEQRGVELSENSLARLNEGVRLAGEKGLDDTLILVDGTAFLVSVKNNRVITTVNHGELKGNIFTNIDGTVII